NVGRLLKHLDDKGLRDNTIVVFMTDNGPAGERYNADMKGKKGSMDEGGSRVPCFVSWPARFKTPRLIPQIAMHIDMFPTLMELCGLRMPKTLPVDGRSLVPLLEGRSEGWPERVLFTQHMLTGRKGNSAAAVRTQQYRAVMQGKDWRLYDMEADPSQLKDIATEKPEVVKKLAADYKAWWQDVKADADKPRDIPELGHVDENPIELTTPNGRLAGGLDFGGLAPNNSWVHNWRDVNGSVTWELNVVEAGDYSIELQYLCPQADAGAKIEVVANDKSFPAVVGATPVIALPSPDRVPREKEAFEMKWFYLKPGTVHLEKGRVEIQVKAVEKPGEEVMQLKALWMRRKG
ncbi:MAG: atsA 16, partial [Verrucomicrobiaceae bacterium]|nr:atsA 16 [Verrucomicrobiaceae bacterium]